MKTFVTADLHFGHKNILGHQTNRNFKTVQEMDDHIVRVWNQNVSPKDEVYVVGDFSFRADIIYLADILASLNGTLHLVRGNHDHDFWKALDIMKGNKHLKLHKKDPEEIIVHRDRIVDVKHNGYKYVMCHYPLETWDGAARKIRGYAPHGKRTFMLHGHNHGKGTAIKDRLDVGYDALGNVVTPLDLIPGMLEKQNERLVDKETRFWDEYLGNMTELTD